MSRLGLVPPGPGHGCGKVERLLDSYLSGELTVETSHEILDHLRRCDACRGESEARERLRAAIRRIGGEVPPPRPELLDEVSSRLRGEAAEPSPAAAWASRLALAAALVLGVSLSVRSFRPSPASASVDSGAFALASATQHDCALGTDWPEKPKPLAEIVAEAEPAYRPAVVAASRKPGYHVVAAHDCGHGGQLAFHVVLRQDGSDAAGGIVSLVVLKKSNGSLPPAAILANEAGVVLTGGKSRGFDVVGAETPRSLLFVVSGRGSFENAEIGRAILPALAATL